MSVVKRRFRAGIYPRNITVVFAETLQAAAKNIRFKEDTDDYHAVTVNREAGIFLLFSAAPTAGQIAHECKHAVNLVFSHIQQQLDLHNDEAECYLLQFIVDKVHQTKACYDHNRPVEPDTARTGKPRARPAKRG